mmetsp:Transcript_97156/g.280388  ORF Transcript_97156/g.280388 Transcript_97156/m.280388 type:complete len:323 (+) Transcript_97156:1734-2702(+)
MGFPRWRDVEPVAIACVAQRLRALRAPGSCYQRPAGGTWRRRPRQQVAWRCVHVALSLNRIGELGRDCDRGYLRDIVPRALVPHRAVALGAYDDRPIWAGPHAEHVLAELELFCVPDERTVGHRPPGPLSTALGRLGAGEGLAHPRDLAGCAVQRVGEDSVGGDAVVTQARSGGRQRPQPHRHLQAHLRALLAEPRVREEAGHDGVQEVAVARHRERLLRARPRGAEPWRQRNHPAGHLAHGLGVRGVRENLEDGPRREASVVRRHKRGCAVPEPHGAGVLGGQATLEALERLRCFAYMDRTRRPGQRERYRLRTLLLRPRL